MDKSRIKTTPSSDDTDHIARISLSGQLEKFGEFSSFLTEMEDDPKIKSIEIEICSPGGDLSTGLALTGRILTCSKDVVSIGYGEVSSAAVLPFIVCNYRYMSSMCNIMLHNILVNISGFHPLPIIESMVAHWRKLNDDFYKYLGKYSNKSAKYWRKRLEGGSEHYIYPDEALELGMCDEII